MMNADQALRAIVARIKGEFDQPDLMGCGPLSTDTMADVLAIAEKGSSHDIHVGIIDHRHGHNTYAAQTKEGLLKQIVNYCRGEWKAEVAPEHPVPDDDDECITRYFDLVDDESLDMVQVELL
jgi:hypothetical protein